MPHRKQNKNYEAKSTDYRKKHLVSVQVDDTAHSAIGKVVTKTARTASYKGADWRLRNGVRECLHVVVPPLRMALRDRQDRTRCNPRMSMQR